MTRWDWMDDALCRQVSPDFFHPGANELSLAAKAKKICGTCPVIDRCLDYALAQPGIHGILGGTTEKERRTMRRRKAQNEAQGDQGVRDTGTAGIETSIRIPTR